MIERRHRSIEVRSSKWEHRYRYIYVSDLTYVTITATTGNGLLLRQIQRLEEHPEVRVCVPVCLWLSLSVCLFACPCVCLSVCLSVCACVRACERSCVLACHVCMNPYMNDMYMCTTYISRLIILYTHTQNAGRCIFLLLKNAHY